MTPYFRKLVWVPALLALGSLFTILGSAVRAKAWHLLTVECLLTGVLIAAILWLLQTVRRTDPGQPSGYEATILLLLCVVVAAGAVQVVFRR